MRTRYEIEEDLKNIYYGKLMLEVLLDMREQLEDMKEYLRHIE